MKVLTFEEIESKMPVTKGILDGAYIMNLTFSKHVFGYDLIDLTPKVAQHLIGKEFICVKGQHHDDYITKSQKMQSLRKLKAVGFNTKRNNEGQPNLVLENEDGHQYEAYVFDGLYTSGSGADPIYVFATT